MCALYQRCIHIQYIIVLYHVLRSCVLYCKQYLYTHIYYIYKLLLCSTKMRLTLRYMGKKPTISKAFMIWWQYFVNYVGGYQSK